MKIEIEVGRMAMGGKPSMRECVEIERKKNPLADDAELVAIVKQNLKKDPEYYSKEQGGIPDEDSEEGEDQGMEKSKSTNYFE